MTEDAHKDITPTPTPDDAQASQAQRLNGNDAVNLAAKQSEKTADKNLPGFGDLPIPDDTANLRQGPNLHDGLLALLPLVGVWRGEGQAIDKEGKEYAFGQQLVFAHDGENYLSYQSRTWRLDENGEFAGVDDRESGFWRISLDDNIEVISAHANGGVEIMYGQPISERAWQLESASTMVTETGPKQHGPGKRLFGLMPNNELGWVDERLVDGELTPKRSAQLHRHMG